MQIGSTKPGSIAEVELIYRSKCKANDRPLITHSNDAYGLLLDTWDKDKIELVEQFKIVLLDRKQSCMGISTIALGGISACHVDLKIAFATALKARASNMILAHNHPSGNKKPSDNDLTLTQRFIAAGKILELPVLDHLIVTNDGYYSMADEGQIVSLNCAVK